MAKYKPGQFIKVPNRKGLYRVKRGICKNCALYYHKCISSCLHNTGWSGIIVRVK